LPGPDAAAIRIAFVAILYCFDRNRASSIRRFAARRFGRRKNFYHIPSHFARITLMNISRSSSN
jgi:hypothetical protein